MFTCIVVLLGIKAAGVPAPLDYRLAIPLHGHLIKETANGEHYYMDFTQAIRQVKAPSARNNLVQWVPANQCWLDE